MPASAAPADRFDNLTAVINVSVFWLASRTTRFTPPMSLGCALASLAGGAFRLSPGAPMFWDQVHAALLSNLVTYCCMRLVGHGSPSKLARGGIKARQMRKKFGPSMF